MGSFNDIMAQGTLWAFAMVFGAGVLTSLTPCVLPMIPITVAIFGAKETRSRGMAFLLATFYVMGIAVMYAGLGILAALGGWAAGSLLTSPWFVVPLCIFFVVMATSMFGLWEIRLPIKLQNAMSGVGGKGLGGAFLMGLVGGILIAPCTGPVLAGILAYVATTRDAVMGGALLFTYALGIGVLFWVLATFAVSLPKSGVMMESVKSLLGIALIGAALYFLQNVFPPLARFTSGDRSFALMCGGAVMVGIAVGGIHLTLHQGTLKVVRKVVGILLLSAGTFGLVNFALTPSTKLPWIYQEQEAMTLAKKEQRPVLVDFWASYCAPCKVMEATIFTHPAVLRELERFVLFKVDVSKDTARDQRLRDKFRAPSELPLLVFLDASGKEYARAGKVDRVATMLELLRSVPSPSATP